MDVREFVKKKVAEGERQMDIANRTGVSQGTIYKLLYTNTRPTMDTIMKIAAGYGISYTSLIDADRVAETRPAYGSQPTMTEREQKLLRLFRNLDERRQDRAIDNLEDMVSGLKDAYERGGPAKDCKVLNCGAK